MTTVLQIVMPDESKWHVPAHLIAQNRAQYYAKRETDRNPQKKFRSVFTEEFNATMEDHECLIDWAESNMNWSDVRLHAFRVSAPDVDFQEGWVNGKKQVLNIP